MKILLISFLFGTSSFAQNANSIWCFSDPAGIDFGNARNHKAVIAIYFCLNDYS